MLRNRGRARLLVLAATSIAAIAWSGSATGATPLNDAFAAAAELNGRTTHVTGGNKDATKEAGEPDHAGEPGGASVWYRWEAPADGRATIDTCDSTFDTLLAVYTGSAVDVLDEVASNDDDCVLGSAVSFNAEQGLTYRIAVDGLDGETGAIGLHLNLGPPNDRFADAAQLSGDAGSLDGTTEGASAEFGETDLGWSVGHSVWYAWTAPSSGPASFETCGSDVDTVLVVYTGTALDSLTFITASDDACGSASRVHFQATAGVVYRVAVDGYGYGLGDFTLTWNRNPPPKEPPYWSDDPIISGVARVGHTLVASDGEWEGTPPFEFAFAWGRCDRTLDICDFIPGASSRNYTLTSGDVGSRIFVRVTASNSAGSDAAYSSATALVGLGAPVSTAAPMLSGTPQVGATLFAAQGSWSGMTPMQFTYRWQRCDSAGNGCVDLAGQNGSVLEVRLEHAGFTLRVLVTAANLDGSATAASSPTSVVARPQQTQARRCVVPNVKRKSVATARKAIRRSGCTPGRVRRAYSNAVGKGRVISQSPRPGARLKPSAKVNLVLSRGRKR